mmetsp:Transcript_1376/g.2359  ORF Transcript_1376/g.2359 Transcript_1376/m.2359 type:complete len:189 (-) Transcript_1376:66-632(-)
MVRPTTIPSTSSRTTIRTSGFLPPGRGRRVLLMCDRGRGRGGGRPPHDWLSSRWRWGYAVGEAHDAAAELRQRLGRKEARETWVNQLLDKEDVVPWDEALLALALRIQRSVNTGQLGRGQELAQVLDNMAGGKYGSGAEPNEDLCQALEKGVKELASGEALVSGFQGDKDRATLLKALLSMNFVKDGL